MDFNVDEENMDLNVHIAKYSEAVLEATFEVLVFHTALMETRVKRNASGRPGPNVITGDYRRSITSEVVATKDGAFGTVGTANPQGRRLEYGFVGADAIGRHYNQPPYPHFRPAFAETVPGFVEDINEVLAL